MDGDQTERETEGVRREENQENQGEVQTEEQELEELRAQILNLLLELEEARDTSQKHQENSAELQGLLDDERLASAHQAESFTRQIQNLQAQLSSVQDLQEELRSAQEEIQLLQQTAEEYEAENVTLRAEIAMKSQRRDEDRRREGDVDQLKENFSRLKVECDSLKETNNKLTEKLQQLQRTGSGRTCVPLKEEVEGEEGEDGEDGEDREVQRRPGPGSGGTCRLADACVQKNVSFDGKPLTPTSLSLGFSEMVSLREQLKQAEERAELLQRQCNGVRTELRELQDLFETSQKERAELELELLHCREELERLTETQFSTQPAILSLPFLGMIVIVALMRCWWSGLASQHQ
ncbi:coiled-coil domain-containing protein 136 isoform X2 [Trichomycterus rosablanca]